MLSLPVFLHPPSLLFALPFCPSHSRHRTFGETLETCLFALLSSSFAKTLNHRASTRCFTVGPSKKSRDSRWSWLSALSGTFTTTVNVIYQPGCILLLGNVTVLTVLWRLSGLSLVVWKWEEIDSHKSKLSMTQLHTSLWNRFRALQ